MPFSISATSQNVSHHCALEPTAHSPPPASLTALVRAPPPPNLDLKLAFGLKLRSYELKERSRDASKEEEV